MPLRTSRRTMLGATLAMLSLAALSACGSKDTKSDSAPQGAAASGADHGTVLDVRTENEFNQGHLEGALNYDVSSSDFDQKIGGLDKSGRYTVYCRSGNRSAAAAKRMKSLGFTDVQDAGGMKDASKTLGLAVVK
ncbi:rhodanese-like domain-containing protein [Actinomyces trachealis]|uniref:rhodanese-like domain-containing protein n=1 Tax=Actinomyces trachealis TaxID=2763540 RepID=UPI0018C7468D|nr:rhodanese-like domain-containing protein [Actinomyces trachealis]